MLYWRNCDFIFTCIFNQLARTLITPLPFPDNSAVIKGVSLPYIAIHHLTASAPSFSKQISVSVVLSLIYIHLDPRHNITDPQGTIMRFDPVMQCLRGIASGYLVKTVAAIYLAY